MRNEYRPLDERDDVLEMSTSDLIKEFAFIKVEGVLHEPDLKRHARLGQVVDELRRRGVLD